MRKSVNTTIPKLIWVILLSAILCGCGGENKENNTDEPAQAVEAVSPTEPVMTVEPESPVEPVETDEPDETDAEKGRQDGERFEDTIMLEGMEETVRYEHVKDPELGFEMDYDYESLVRDKETDKERFISAYDDTENPVNYLEITYTEKTADNTVSSIGEELSKEYDIITEQSEPDDPVSCTKLVTINSKSGAGSPDLLQTVYIIPAGDGSIVATAHYTIESAEGFGHRFDQMVDTLTVIERKD